MRVITLLPLLGALLPAVLAIPSSENLCTPGTQRCNDNELQKCDNHHVWLPAPCPTGQTCDPMIQACEFPDDHRCRSNTWRCRDTLIEKCVRERWMISQTCAKGTLCAMSGRGGGIPSCRKPLSLVPRSKDSKTCNPGDRTCDHNAYILRVCNKDSKWELEKKCTTPGDCKIVGPGQAHCERGGIDPPKLARNDNRNTTPQPCTPGNRNCHGDLQTVMLCNSEGEWIVEKKCAARGGCKDDPPNQAHCASEPSKELGTAVWGASCVPGSAACDSKRRFLFQCDNSGKWGQPNQCFRDGYCRLRGEELTCDGFPLYDGHNKQCDSHCEFMSWLQCTAADDRTEQQAKCLQWMCWENTCIECDRCRYKMPSEGVKPDLTTVVLPRPPQE